MQLTQEEKSLLDSVERGKWKRIPDFPREAARYQAAARATLKKDKRVNIRIINARLGIFVPMLVTPMELCGEDSP